MPRQTPIVEKRGRGRPPKDERAVLGDAVTIRLAHGEREMFEASAQKQGLSVSEWIRQTLKKAVKR